MREANRQRTRELFGMDVSSGRSFGRKPQRSSASNMRSGVRLGEATREFLPDALGHQVVGFARGDHPLHQRQRVVRDAEGEARGEARDAQDAHRILVERGADVPQHAVAQVGFAVERIDERSVRRPGHRVDGEVAAREVLLERHVGRAVDGEALVAAPALSLGARERVLLVRLRVQEDREILADRPEARGGHLLGRRADDDVVRSWTGRPSSSSRTAPPTT